MSRRRLMASAEALRAAALAGVLAVAALGLLTVPGLAVLGFVGACGTVACGVMAPALSAGATVLLAGLREPARPALPPRHPLDDLREGAIFVAGHRLLRPVLATQAIFNTAFFVLQAVHAPWAVHRLGLSASGVGLTLALHGVGMIGGALLAGRLLRALPFGIVVVGGPLAGLAAAVALALTIWLPSPSLAALAFFLFGADPILRVISTTTRRRSVTPPRLLGRVPAINSTVYGCRPLGAAIGALLGGLHGAEACLLVAAVGFLVQAAVIVASPVTGRARQPAPPAG